MSKVPPDSELSPEPKDGWLTTNGIQMHCLDWTGQLRQAGPGTPIARRLPVVALHGLASSAHWYDLTLPHLASDYPCYALDQRAHGLTDQPATGYDWRTLADDVFGALDALGLERVALLGHSWGATVALKAAALHPDRVERLVMIDGGFFGRGTNVTWEDFRQRLRPRDIYGPKQRYLQTLRDEFSHVWTERLERIVLSMPALNPDDTLRERLEPANHEQVLRAMYTEPASESYSLIKCPTMLIAASPRETPSNQPFLARRREAVAMAHAAMANSSVVWIEDSGHDIGYEKPLALAQTIDRFLQSAQG